jgi:hypothetical protein
MKRTVALFLSLIMIFSVFQVAFPVFAADYGFESVVLSESELTLNTDSGGKGKHTLTVAYVDGEGNIVEAPEEAAILWKENSNSTVVRVNEITGEITAVANGECIVTAMVYMDEPTDIYAECKVTVRDKKTNRVIETEEYKQANLSNQ